MKKLLFLLTVFAFSSINSVSVELTGGKFRLIPYQTQNATGQYYNELELYYYNKTDNPDFKNLHLYNLYRGKETKFHTETERLSIMFGDERKDAVTKSNFDFGFTTYRSKLLVDNFIKPDLNDFQLWAIATNRSSYYEAAKNNPIVGAMLLDESNRLKGYKYSDRLSPGFHFRYINGFDSIKFYSDLFIALQGKSKTISYTDMLVLNIGTKIDFEKFGILIETSMSYNETMYSYSSINGVHYKSYFTHSFRIGASVNL
ncbi:MAG: hypothetical protein KBA66_16565 [Leptospiraceae bacterium]|nr:hypothetical protein [Leptospiraceae bacterium]